jgi:hypothetical protein
MSDTFRVECRTKKNILAIQVTGCVWYRGPHFIKSQIAKLLQRTDHVWTWEEAPQKQNKRRRGGRCGRKEHDAVFLGEVIPQTYRQCTYDATWDTFLQPLLLWKSNAYDIFWVCNCSHRYSGCNAHTPYCHLWPAWLYGIIHIISKTARFSKKILTAMKRVFWFSLHLFS